MMKGGSRSSPGLNCPHEIPSGTTIQVNIQVQSINFFFKKKIQLGAGFARTWSYLRFSRGQRQEQGPAPSPVWTGQLAAVATTNNHA